MSKNTPQPSSYYDEDFRKQAQKYFVGNYKRRNMLVAKLVTELKPRSIFHFAAAEGQLSRFILERNPQIKLYHWTDFSPEAYRISHEHLKYFPNLVMTLLDIDKDYAKVEWQNYDMVISSSLEHIVHDREIIQSIKPETLVVLSLPSFTSKGHVRFFPNLANILQRYGDLLEWIYLDSLITKPKNWYRQLARTIIVKLGLSNLFIRKEYMHQENKLHIVIAKRGIK